jgi:hypothetical protein
MTPKMNSVMHISILTDYRSLVYKFELRKVPDQEKPTYYSRTSTLKDLRFYTGDNIVITDEILTKQLEAMIWQYLRHNQYFDVILEALRGHQAGIIYAFDLCQVIHSMRECIAWKHSLPKDNRRHQELAGKAILIAGDAVYGPKKNNRSK